MGQVCSGKDNSANDVPQPNRRMIAHEGKPFCTDEDAQTGAKEWCNKPGNEGWTYTGKYMLVETGKKGKKKRPT